MKTSKKTVKVDTPNRKIKNAQKLVIDGKSFRSKLEVYCYQRLKENNIEFEYESTRFNLLPSFTFNGESFESYKKKGKWDFGEKSNTIRGITYNPDFLNLTDGWLIECKGYPNDSWAAKWKLFKYLLSSNGLTLDLYLPKNQGHVDLCIDKIKSKLISTGILVSQDAQRGVLNERQTKQ
jgi:hypothetical protein